MARFDTGANETVNVVNICNGGGDKGWICPRCGAVNAPWVRRCDCKPEEQAVPYVPTYPVPTFPVSPWGPYPNWPIITYTDNGTAARGIMILEA